MKSPYQGQCRVKFLQLWAEIEQLQHKLTLQMLPPTSASNAAADPASSKPTKT